MIIWEVNQEEGKKIKKNFFGHIVKKTLDYLSIEEANISIAVIGANEIKEANKNYRGKNKVTDVLSFVYEKNPLEGEILICYDKIKDQAEKMGHSLEEELKILLVHSLVHLAGHDHKKDAEAKKMKKIENLILEKI